MKDDAERLADLYETLTDLEGDRSDLLAEYEGAEVPDWAQVDYDRFIRDLDEQISLTESLIEDLGGELP